MSPNTQNPKGIDSILQRMQKKAETQAASPEQSDIILDIDTEKNPEIIQKEGLSLLDAYNSINEWIVNQGHIKLREKLEFFELLGTVVNAGISVNESLQLLADQTRNPKLKSVIYDLRRRIEDGSSLADAMLQNSDAFDEATCAIIRAGEKSGKLTEVLKELSIQYQRMHTLQKKVQSVLMYPMIVTIVMALLTIVVMVFIVPKLIDLFGDPESLPLPTRLLIGMSDFMLHNYLLLILGVIVAIFSFKFWKKTKSGKYQWGIVMINVPFFGPILKGMILSRVTRIFGFLISSGVPIIEALRISSSVAQNPLYQEKLILAADDLGKGIPIAENLSDSEKLFPRMLVNMIAIGEQSASLEAIMGKVANFYDEEIERKIQNLSKVLEPFILAIIAGAAVFMMLAIYLPILKMNSQVMG